MIYKYFNEFMETINNCSNCTILITKNFEDCLTRKSKEKQKEIKLILKRKNIKLELLKQKSDNWNKKWNWTGKRDKHER